jgi:tetratricopeptide (TPR) repeat protein
LLLFSSLITTAQDKSTQVQREDSVAASAGISKEQLALEDQLNAVLLKADQAIKAGQPDEAVKQYEVALTMVHKEPLLAEQKERVLRKADSAYLQANRPADAIQISQELIESLKKDCDSNSTAVSTCADAQQQLAVARMHTGDFEGGLTALQQAEANYAKAEKASTRHEFTMIEIKEEAQTKIFAAVALFRLGKIADAAVTIDEAIAQLNRVKDDNSINVGIREDATNSIQEAHTILEKLKAAK